MFSWLKVAVVTDGMHVNAFRIMEEDLSLNLQEKQAVVAEVSAQVAQAQTIVLAEYRGIEVGDITKLRANARAAGVYFHVLKNTLARRAVDGTAFADLANHMAGPLVYGISADPIAAEDWFRKKKAKPSTTAATVIRARSPRRDSRMPLNQISARFPTRAKYTA